MSTIYMHWYTIGKLFLKELSENILDRRKTDCQSINRCVVLLRSGRAQRWEEERRRKVRSWGVWRGGVLASWYQRIRC